MQANSTQKPALYQSIAEKIETLIKLNAYKKDESLPSCRDLAVQLKVNPNTIARAYKLLEEKQVVFTIPKKGIFVAFLENKDENLHEEIKKILKGLKEQGVSKKSIETLLDEIYGGKNDKSNKPK